MTLSNLPKFFETALAGRNGAKARGYLADRGLDPATQVKFRIGYSPNERFALKEYLGGEGCRYPTWLRPACLCRVKKFRFLTIAFATG